jgi:rod shape determining protein RodA
LRKETHIFQNIDWTIVSIYVALVIFGWLNIYAAVFNENHKNILDITQNYGKQLLWIILSLVLALVILIIDGKFYPAFSYPI